MTLLDHIVVLLVFDLSHSAVWFGEAMEFAHLFFIIRFFVSLYVLNLTHELCLYPPVEACASS